MPIPPKTLIRMIKSDIAGIDGHQRIDILNKYLNDLPGIYQGEFGKLRKWIKSQIDSAKTQQKVRSNENYFVHKEGDCQVALLGMPNVGKSSLLKSLTGIQIKIGDYPFTTTKPTPSILRINGALLQLVEIPGLFEGAADGLAHGSSLLAAARVADRQVWIADLSSGGVDVLVLKEETSKAGLGYPQLIIGTHGDHPDAYESIKEIRQLMSEMTGAPGTPETPKTPMMPEMTWAPEIPKIPGIPGTPEIPKIPGIPGTPEIPKTPEIPLVVCSNKTQEGMEEVKQQLWNICGLLRIYLKKPFENSPAEDPMVVETGTTIYELAAEIHKDFAAKFQGARVWGTSVKFPGQAVSSDHVLEDEDIVEIIAP